MNALLFPLLAIIFSTITYMFSDLFIPLKSLIIPFLFIIMLGMGMTLSLKDFKEIFNKKAAVTFGMSAQFFIMPLAAFIISKFLNLDQSQTIGMMLVGTSAGGTASNVITYLAKGDLALSISMTLLSTIIATFLMPLLMYAYIGQTIEIPVNKMLISLAQITILPLSIGILLNSLFKNFIDNIKVILPAISMAAIIFIIGVIIAINAKNIDNLGSTILIAIILHNLIGMLFGYFGSKLFKFDEKTSRTIAIEVGMQNSGLSVALAIKYFSSASALCGAIFSVWHNISGAIFASYCKYKNNSL